MLWIWIVEELNFPRLARWSKVFAPMIVLSSTSLNKSPFWRIILDFCFLISDLVILPLEICTGPLVTTTEKIQKFVKFELEYLRGDTNDNNSLKRGCKLLVISEMCSSLIKKLNDFYYRSKYANHRKIKLCKQFIAAHHDFSC